MDEDALGRDLAVDDACAPRRGRGRARRRRAARRRAGVVHRRVPAGAHEPAACRARGGAGARGEDRGGARPLDRPRRLPRGRGFARDRGDGRDPAGADDRPVPHLVASAAALGERAARAVRRRPRDRPRHARDGRGRIGRARRPARRPGGRAVPRAGAGLACGAGARRRPTRAAPPHDATRSRRSSTAISRRSSTSR